MTTLIRAVTHLPDGLNTRVDALVQATGLLRAAVLRLAVERGVGTLERDGVRVGGSVGLPAPAEPATVRSPVKPTQRVREPAPAQPTRASKLVQRVHAPESASAAATRAAIQNALKSPKTRVAPPQRATGPDLSTLTDDQRARIESAGEDARQYRGETSDTPRKRVPARVLTDEERWAELGDSMVEGVYECPI